MQTIHHNKYGIRAALLCISVPAVLYAAPAHAVPANLNIVIENPPEDFPIPDPIPPVADPSLTVPEPETDTRPGGGASGSWFLRSRSLRTVPSQPAAPGAGPDEPSVTPGFSVPTSPAPPAPVTPIFPVRSFPGAAPPAQPAPVAAATVSESAAGTDRDTTTADRGIAPTPHPVRITAENGFSAELFVERLDITSYGVFGTHPVLFLALLTLITNIAAVLFPYRRRHTAISL